MGEDQMGDLIQEGRGEAGNLGGAAGELARFHRVGGGQVANDEALPGILKNAVFSLEAIGYLL
jgi:hypothetical protein